MLVAMVYGRDVVPVSEQMRRRHETCYASREYVSSCTRGAGCTRNLRRSRVVMDRLPPVLRVDLYDDQPAKERMELRHIFNST